ncbi:MAG: hypothetical protein ACOY94_11480 [Bacillota bacterium]
MASPVISALEAAMYTGSSPKGQFWAFKHPNPDAPPQTYRLTRRSGNGWTLILAASKETGEVLSFHADTPEDQAAVKEALKWLGIKGEIVADEDGVSLRLAKGGTIKSQLVGGEKPKKK